MGKYVRIVRGAGIHGAIQALKAEHRAEVNRFPDVARYLQDHQPAAWAKVSACRTQARVARHVVRGDLYKVRLYGCHVEPWCIACVREAKHRRAAKALDRFARCTPASQPLRLAHIVMNAQLREDGSGWGRKAADNVAAFRQIMGRVLADSYGPGFGAFVSYHDFGERAFGKPSPHLDLTLNGWTLGTAGPERTLTYNLRDGGHAAWVRRTRQHAAARFLIHTEDVEIDLNLQAFVLGAPAYYAALLYQVRELVDIRKMTYDRARNLVWWASYRYNQREKMTIQQFHDGLTDYQRRLGNWGNFQTRRLHAGVGHLADHRLDDTEAAMGGAERPHGTGCYCAACHEWELVWPDEQGEYAFDPWMAEPFATGLVAA